MAGRPPLRIGQHGKIVRVDLGGGVWLARTRFRDSDGVTRRVERRSPDGADDKHGKAAENALVETLTSRRAPSDDEISLDTKISVLVDRHLIRLAEDDRSPVTLSTYEFAAGKLAKIIGGVRVGESTPARIDAAIRSMKTGAWRDDGQAVEDDLAGRAAAGGDGERARREPCAGCSADHVEGRTEGGDGA